MGYSKRKRAELTTRGWSPEYRKQILAGIEEKGIERICGEFGITWNQVMKLIARERHMAAHRAATLDRKQFLERVEKKAQEGLMVALERGLEMIEKERKQFGKLGKLSTDVLKGTGSFQPDTQVSLNQLVQEVPVDWRKFYLDKEEEDGKASIGERGEIPHVERGIGEKAGG